MKAPGRAERVLVPSALIRSPFKGRANTSQSNG